MATVNDSAELRAFARTFLDSRQVSHHSEIRTDDLADFFRAWFGLRAFAQLPDLYEVCQRLGAPVRDLPTESDDLLAVNTFHSGQPAIFLRPDLAAVQAEHTLAHELREVIENTFMLVSPNYEGLDTSDNKQMNPESDQFGSCLLMPSRESKALMEELG
jgi:Zn-dependent peptidase ImmA (M78 family)